MVRPPNSGAFSGRDLFRLRRRKAGMQAWVPSAGCPCALSFARTTKGRNMPGIHHVTAISGAPERNLDFYSRVLALRLVKKTVNFDDPGTYHLYYGDEQGAPGTILTFFPWSHAAQGRLGAG